MKRGQFQHPCHDNPMGYIAWHEMARRLTRRGIRQTMCPICERLMFPSEECAERLAQRAEPVLRVGRRIPRQE